MRYEVYRNKNSSDEEFGYINEIYKRIMTEDKGLCNGVQGNLNADVFVNGEMHPRWEKGPIHFQKTVRELVMAHFNLEQKAGRKIEPAKQKLPNTASVSEKDIDFCARVDSCTMSEEGGDLEW